MPKTTGIGTRPLTLPPTAPAAQPAAPAPVATVPASADQLDLSASPEVAAASLLGTASSPASAAVATPTPAPTHGSLWDEVCSFASLFREVPEAAAQAVKQSFESTGNAVRDAKGLSDEQLRQLPPAQLASLGDQLLGTRGVSELWDAASTSDRTAQLLRVVSARGTSPGAVDSVVSMMAHAGDIAARTGGPHRAALLALTEPHPATPGDWAGFERYVDDATGTVERPGTRVEPLIDGANAFPQMLQSVDAAKSSIDLTMFAFQSDATGWSFAQHLAAAADRGCQVRVMFDPFGSRMSGNTPTDPKLYDFLKQHGVQVQCYPPSPMGDHMTHRKILVTDGTTGYVGGMNIGDQYSEQWHDVHSRVTGPGVADLQKAFVDQWRTEGGQISAADEQALFPALSPVGDGEARIVPHVGDGDVNMKLTYLRAIDTAAKDIHVANPYLSDPEVMEHLIAAAKRGVEVTIVVPQNNDSGPERDIEESWYNALTGAGAHVYEYPDRMAHDKVATFDGKLATIGSSNLDARSLESNDECNVWTPDASVAQDVDERLFARDTSISTPVTQFKPGLFRSTWDDVLNRLQTYL